eukprot:gnl/MRDRNA2_/MRDRNA2_28949_c0_seq1.p1 gnl/MRDRNA2_/MRDRNA2_28949_c0~~gnl/MRDRNA2_/MRDRNA2_28949_c0_seq1.p1  ORF type:complete len:478 (+),score=109.27 gnl/MRDRNA2_/MRDRNA2_28949_c0_seq1:84-1517(+)
MSGSLTEAFEWPKKTLQCLKKELGQKVLDKSLLGKGAPISTYFSGVGTPELALETLGNAKVKNVSVGHFETVSACDWDSGCRNILMQKHPNALIYGDILERIPPKVKKSTAYRSGSFERKRQAIAQCSTQIPATTYSKDENGKIVTKMAVCPPSIVDMSGSPCTDWSMIGIQKGAEGKTAPIFLTWMQIQRENDTPVIIHENVRRFPVDQLKKVFGDKYDIYSIDTCPADVGFGLLNRNRRYDVLLHKERTCLLADIPETYKCVKEALGDNGRPWKRLDVFMQQYGSSKLSELLEEERHKAAARGIRCKDSAKKGGENLDWSYLLLQREKTALRDFTKMWKEKYPEKKDPSEDPNCIFHIGDNPLKRLVWSATGTIPTFRRGGGLYWMPYYRRWILPKERLALMGFPIYPALAKASGVDVMKVENMKQAKMMAGNAMHLPNAGAILAVTLACVQVKDSNKRKSSEMCAATAKRRKRA